KVEPSRLAIPYGLLDAARRYRVSRSTAVVVNLTYHVGRVFSRDESDEQVLRTIIGDQNDVIPRVVCQLIRATCGDAPHMSAGIHGKRRGKWMAEIDEEHLAGFAGFGCRPHHQCSCPGLSLAVTGPVDRDNSIWSVRHGN